MALLEINHVFKGFGGVKAIQDFSMEADLGEIHGIIGPNGAGKTSLFNVISGVYPADGGTVILEGRNITKMEQYRITREGISRTFQNIRLFRGLNVLENVLCAFDPHSKYGLLSGLFPGPRRYTEEKRGREICGQFLDMVGLGKYLEESPSNLPYGLQRKLEIARALTCNPKVLLLDEPAAGLNPTEVEELTSLILKLSRDIGFTIIIIEHRLDLVMSISNIIHVMNFGKKITMGAPDEVRNNPDVIEAYMGKED
jgi:branched-chain amino acid transport system ATP-binding protein